MSEETPPKPEAAAVSPPRLAYQIDRIVRFIVWTALVGSTGCICAIVLIGSWDTVGRLINRPLLGAVEMTEALLAATIFLALPYAQREYRHVVVDILSQNFKGRLLRAADLLALVATWAMFAFLFQQSLNGALHAYQVGEVSSGAIRVPVWLAKLFAAGGLLIAAFETFRQIVFELLWPEFEHARRTGAAAAEAKAMGQM
ncbi:MAG: TRAP transporter small permease [Pseudorhodobacter sp.]